MVCVVSVYLIIALSGPPDTDYQSNAHAVDPRFHWIPTFLGAALAVAGALMGRPWLLVLGFAAGFLWNLVGLYLLLYLPRPPALDPAR